MSSQKVVIGGWGISVDYLKKFLGEGIYIDVNSLIPQLFDGETLSSDWKEKAIELLKQKISDELVTITAWSTGTVFAWLLKDSVQCDSITMISAFPSFCRQEGFRFGMRQSVVQAMRQNLHQDKTKTMRSFFSQCGFAEENMPSISYDTKTLTLGLQFLELASILPIQKLSTPITFIHGSSDKIVSPRSGKLFAEASGGEWREVEGGHAVFESGRDMRILG